MEGCYLLVQPLFVGLLPSELDVGSTGSAAAAKPANPNTIKKQDITAKIILFIFIIVVPPLLTLRKLYHILICGEDY